MIKTKINALLGCLLLVGMAVPLTTAHLTGPSATSEAFTDDSYRYTGDTPSSNSGVSGTYVGPAGGYLVSPTLFGSSAPVVIATALCDAEVAGTGNPPMPQDEEDVDGVEGGEVPDGTWDDGGFGGACHTNNHYEYTDYNSAGCVDGDPDAETAYAEDAVSGGNVWIGASCDWETTGGGTGLSTCVINSVLGWDLNNPTSLAGDLGTCAGNFVAGGGNGATFVDCGNDGVADATNYGRGSAGVAFPNFATDGVAAHGCNAGHESAAVFVFEYFDENTGDVTPAVGGWIDTPDDPAGENQPVNWVGAATVVVEGFPASADEGIVVCGTGVGGFCMPSSVVAVYVQDKFLGPDIAFQVCRDNNGDGVCTNAETRFSHHNDGSFQNPVQPPDGSGMVITFICAGAHNLPTSEGPHSHSATLGFSEARGAGGGFTAPDGFCGGGATGGKRYFL